MLLEWKCLMKITWIKLTQQQNFFINTLWSASVVSLRSGFVTQIYRVLIPRQYGILYEGDFSQTNGDEDQLWQEVFENLKKKTLIIQRVPSLILYDDLHVEILVLLYKIGSPLYKVYSKLRLPVINMTKIMFIFFTNLVHPRCCPESSVNRGLQIDNPLVGAHQRRHLAPSEPTIQLPSLWTLDDVVGYFFHVFDARISNRVI